MCYRNAMSTQSNTPLRASERKILQRKNLRRQAKLRAWLLLTIIIVACVVDVAFYNNERVATGDYDISSQFIFAKSVALGATLNWIAQSVFAWFVLRYTGANYKHKIVGQMYVGQIIKWVIVIFGFSSLFLTIKSLSAAAVIIGFIIMQFGNILIILRGH